MSLTSNLRSTRVLFNIQNIKGLSFRFSSTEIALIVSDSSVTTYIKKKGSRSHVFYFQCEKHKIKQVY